MRRFNLAYVLAKPNRTFENILAWCLVATFSLGCADYGYDIGAIVGYPVHFAMIYYSLATYVAGNVVEVMQECP